MEARKPRKPDTERLVLRAREAELLRGARTVNKTAESQQPTELHICADCGRISSTRPTGHRPRPNAGPSSCAAPTASGAATGVYTQDAVDRFDEDPRRRRAGDPRRPDAS